MSIHSLTESLTAGRLLYQKATLFSSAPSFPLFTVPVDFWDPQAVASFCFLISSHCVWSSESPFPPPEKLTVSKSIHIESSFSLISESLSKPSVITIVAPKWTPNHMAYFELLGALTFLNECVMMLYDIDPSSFALTCLWPVYSSSKCSEFSTSDYYSQMTLNDNTHTHYCF